MRESWTDERLGEFAANVDRRFDKVETELHRIDDRLDGLHRAMVQGIVAMTAGMLAGYAGFFALVATRL